MLVTLDVDLNLDMRFEKPLLFLHQMLNIQTIRDYFLSKKGAAEDTPFGENTLVFKVGGKMFGLTNLEGDLRLNLKCQPEKALELREQYAAVKPGYHMNKVHWNTVAIDGTIPENLIYKWIDDSYNLVFNKLPKAQRSKISGE